MMKKLLFQVVLFLFSYTCFSQPYTGTIFVDSDIIISSDSSALIDVAYSGQEIKTIFDRRANDWITINAFIFEVIWNDGLMSEAVINPEFETVESAEVEALKYGLYIGQLPYCLRIDVDEIWINKGIEAFGGGNNSILIHTGQTTLYENDGILEETLVHEATHTSLDALHSTSIGWLEAQNLDGGFISNYAEEFPEREDMAESFLMWLAVRHLRHRISTEDYELITLSIPNRLNYFDGIDCDLFPVKTYNATTVIKLENDEKNVVVYPIPTTDFIKLKLDDQATYLAIIYNSTGSVMKSTYIKTDQNIDLSEFPMGVYFIVLRNDDTILKKKLLKY